MSSGQPGVGPIRTATHPPPAPDHVTVVLDVQLKEDADGIKLSLTKQRFHVSSSNGLRPDGEPFVEHRKVGPFSIPIV